MDNIALGGGTSRITSRERTIAGSLPPNFTVWGNTENIAVGVDYGADENIVEKTTNLLLAERLG